VDKHSTHSAQNKADTFQPEGAQGPTTPPSSGYANPSLQEGMHVTRRSRAASYLRFERL